MTKEDEKKSEVRINPGYALGQLLKALSSKSEHAARRVKQWQAVIDGMIDGKLNIGSRTPVAGTPAWATLDVVHGGFATGGLAAGGALRSHEVAKLTALMPDGSASEELKRSEVVRAALNAHYTGDDGRAELTALLANGCYRVDVPEEAALLVSAWLFARNERERANDLNAIIAPYFDRMRFYPREDDRPLTPLVGDTVYAQTAGDCAAALRDKAPKREVAKMKEAIQVWTPLYDRLVQLFMSAVDWQAGSEPSLSGAHFSSEWRTSAKAFLYDYEQACRSHTLCTKHKKKKENFARLRSYLEIAADEPARLTASDIASIRRIINAYVTAHGAPDSERLRLTRAEQARIAAEPFHADVAQVLATRLETQAADEGVCDIERLHVPLSADEAAKIGATAGTSVPPALIKKSMRCKVAPLAVLLKERIIGSSEAMAVVLPLLVARTASAAIGDANLARLIDRTYRAFRKRRSLLLVRLESQVRFDELPWIAAVKPWVDSDENSRAAARGTLAQAAALAISEFPYTIFPNKLVKELRALAKAADVQVSLLDELAADIFMGTFSIQYLRAAQEAARVMRGTLYERYYGIDYERILRMDYVADKWNKQVSPEFDKLCFERAATADTRRSGSSVAANGKIIEQAQILTTHGLAGIWQALGFEHVGDAAAARTTGAGSEPNKQAETPASSIDLQQAARTCFKWTSRQLQLKFTDWRTELHTIKNCAYAWRQMIFYVSLLPDDERNAFLGWCREHFEQQPAHFRRRFAPAMNGLLAVADGDTFDSEGRHYSGGVRFLGWTTDRHWLKREPAAEVSRS